MSGLKKEYLGNGISVTVSPEHTFGTDAVLLADFAKPSTRSKCCDLGTGCGIIPLLWCRQKTGDITAVEISAKAVEQLEESIEINNLEDRITAIHSDLRDLKGKVEFGSYNVVTMNPPYTAQGSGVISSSSADKIARHGTMCSLEDACFTASKLLNYGGRLCMCLRPERMCELFSEMKKCSIEPKRIRFVSKCAGKAPWLVLVEGRRGGKSGLTVEPELYVYDGDEFSEEMKNIYGEYYNK